MPPWAFGEAEPLPPEVARASRPRSAGSAGSQTGTDGPCPTCGQEPEEELELEDAIAETRRLLAEIERTDRIGADLARLRAGEIDSLVATTPEEAAAGAGSGTRPAPDR
jgi:hypothetical protein